MYDFTDIERSLELPIKTKFYFWDRLYEVAELEGDEWGCSQCAFAGEERICGVMNCSGYRYDGKHTFFKKVEETEEEKQ